MKSSVFVAALMCVVLAATELQAQGRGGGGRGGGGRGGGGPGPGPGRMGPNGPGSDWRDERGGATWEESLDSAASRVKEMKDGVIIYYAYPEKPELGFLNSSDLRQWIEDNASIVREQFNPKDNAAQKEYGIKSTPTFVGLDKYLNEFLLASNISDGNQLKSFIQKVQEEVRKFQETLRSMAAKAGDFEAKGDDVRAIGEYVKIANTGKKGYPEIETAKDKLKSLADRQLKKAEILMSKLETEKEGVALTESLIKTFKGTPQAMDAELSLAKHLLDKGELGAAMDHLNRVIKADEKQFPDQVAKAQVMTADVVSEGIRQIRAALGIGIDGDLDGAKSKIEKIRKDYSAVTEVSRHASDVLKDLEK